MVRDINGNRVPWWRWALFGLACLVFPPLWALSVVFFIVAGVIAVIGFFSDL
jgi:hypothetical protein